MARPQPIAAEELLAHAGWMRALAARLVRDEATADDVLQDSMLSALRSPPKSAGPVAPWLSRVVRHMASARALRDRVDQHQSDVLARQCTRAGPQVFWTRVCGGGPDREWNIDLDAGGAIEGRVLDKAGHGIAGAIVGITNGDGHPRTMRAGLQGTYRFDGLAAGSWLVRVCEAEIRSDSTTMASWEEEQNVSWSCTVTAGATTHFDVQQEP